MRTIAGFFVAILVGASLCYAQAFPYRDKTDLNNMSEKGEVTLDIAEKTLRQNETYRIKYTFHAFNSSYFVYNWQFIRLKPLPGQLVIYDENMRYIGDLIGFTGGSRAGIGGDDWTLLYDETFLGKPLAFRAGYVPNTKYDSGSSLLPPGTYYIQLVLYKAFLSPHRDPVTFYEKFDRSELCRSNAIRVTIVAR